MPADSRPSSQTRLRALAAVLLLVSATALTACGSGDESAARDRRAAPGSERSEDPQVVEAGGDYAAPRAARTATNATVSAKDGLVVRSPSEAALKWSATAKKRGTRFCLRLDLPVHDPAADCSTGTLLALQFFSDESVGRVVASVDPGAVDKRSAPDALVVTGVASGDVRAVVVNYAQREYPATLSEKNVQLPVDKSLARELSGATKAQQARLPGRVTVRIFAVSFPRTPGNAPAVVDPTTRTPVDGRVTLELS